MQSAIVGRSTGKTARFRDQLENEAPKSKAPKGFDILLQDAISQYKLTEDQIKLLGQMTQRRDIASAQMGHRVYYRRSTIERLFPNAE